MYAHNYPSVGKRDAVEVLKGKKHPHNTEICQIEMSPRAASNYSILTLQLLN